MLGCCQAVVVLGGACVGAPKNVSKSPLLESTAWNVRMPTQVLPTDMPIDNSYTSNTSTVNREHSNLPMHNLTFLD